MNKIFRLTLTVFLFTFAFGLTVSAAPDRPNFNRARTFDIQHYVIRTTFDRVNKTIFGDTTVQLKPLDKNFTTVELDAVKLKFETVTLVPENIQLKYLQTDKNITITLDRAYSPDELISIRFIYSAKPGKGIYFVDDYEDDGEVIRQKQVWTQGEPEEARYWFPSFDFPDDKATSEQFLTVEKGETAIANGELLETTENPDGTQTFHFKMAQPHSTYLTSFVIGTYVRVSENYKNIPLGFYVYPNKTEIVPKAYGKTKDMMRIFEELTGIKYPFNKYDQTIVASFSFGGMENVTATTMADTEILLAKFDFARSGVEDLVSHELAHSWFGNLVTCRNWAELWLNEGFATFMEAAFREKMYGRANYIAKIKGDAEQFKINDSFEKNRHGLFNLLADPDNDDSMFDTTTYQKGGAVVHTLRETVGDEAFWKGINLYLERHKYGNVETHDLQNALEETSGMKLDWFFQQWVSGGGYPKLEVRRVFEPKTGNLTLTISQTQKADNLTPLIFTLPLEVEIKTNRGTTREKILINQRKQVFTINLPDKPLKIVLDPNEQIPLKDVKMIGGK